MCGIFGFSELNDTTRAMAPFLAWEMQERGRQSWGTTDGNEVIRHVGPILSTFELPDHWEQAIFHTRFATHGDISEANQHPFEFAKPDGTRVIGIHNGVISNHEQLNRQYNRDFSVDSMHVYAHLAEGHNLAEIHGYGALAWMESPPDHPIRIHLAKFNMYDLHIAVLKTGEIVFCSLRTPIEKACLWGKTSVDKWYNLTDNKHYVIRPTMPTAEVPEPTALWELADYGTLPFGYRYVTAYSNACTPTYSDSNHNNTSHVYKRAANACATCHRNTLADTKYLFCTACYKQHRGPALHMIDRVVKREEAPTLNVTPFATN